jgi:hypothetical protein
MEEIDEDEDLDLGVFPWQRQVLRGCVVLRVLL